MKHQTKHNQNESTGLRYFEEKDINTCDLLCKISMLLLSTVFALTLYLYV